MFLQYEIIFMSTFDKIQFENLLALIPEHGASDIHLSAGSCPTLRIGEELIAGSEDVLTNLKIEEIILPLLSEEQKKYLSEKRALLFGYTFPNGLRFKINAFYQKGGLAADLHYISGIIKKFNQLGLPDEVINKITEINNGLIIITGPFQAGKTTSAMSLIEYLNEIKQLKIVTLEEPLEFILNNEQGLIQQREIGQDTPSFIDGLKDCLEANVEVVVATRIENKEEAMLILELAEQGRLVIAITSANSTVSFLIKMFSYFDENEKERFRNIFSNNLKLVICQKLVPDKNNQLILVPEIMFKNEAIRLAIINDKLNQVNNIIRTSVSEGMISFEQSLAEFVTKGKISLDHALKYSEDPEELKQKILEQ